MLDKILQQLAAGTAVEWLSTAFGVVYALLAVRRIRWCWLSGAVSSLLLVLLAWRGALPMQAILQAYYVVMSVYGFWRWSAQGADNALQVGTLDWPIHLAVLSAIAVLSWLAGPWLAAWSYAAWPRLDTAVMLGSLFATWLTAQAKIECWLYWVVIDIASITLFGAQGLVVVALLYFAYVLIAASGFFAWNKQWRAQRQV